MKKTVTIFAASEAGYDQKFVQEAQELGKLIGDKGWNVVCGDGGKLVDAVSQAAKDNGSNVANIVTISNIHNDTVGKAYHVKDVYEQQEVLNTAGDAFITLPGSGMTLAEFFSSLVHNYRTKSKKVNAVLNTNNFFSKLFEFFTSIHEFGFSKNKRPSAVILPKSPQKLVDALAAALART